MSVLATETAPSALQGRSIPDIWKPLLASSLLLGLLFAPALAKMVQEWIDLEEMGHGFFVPAVAGWIVWTERDRLKALELKPSYFGIALVVFGFVQYLLAYVGAEMFLQRTAFLMSFVGILWTLGGWTLVRALLFPLFLLTFMVRWPSIVYQQVTFPLQLLASRLAEYLLDVMNVPVLRDGNVLELANKRLSVVEACSGIRSLLSLSFLSLVFGYFFDTKVWMRWVLLVATIPIALLANAGRVTITAWLWENAPEIAAGVFHTIEGWIIFMIALLVLVVTHQAVNAVYDRLRARKEA